MLVAPPARPALLGVATSTLATGAGQVLVGVVSQSRLHVAYAPCRRYTASVTLLVISVRMHWLVSQAGAARHLWPNLGAAAEGQGCGLVAVLPVVAEVLQEQDSDVCTYALESIA